MKLIHPFHLVNNSPWPLTTSISLYYILLSVIMSFNNIIGSFEFFLLGILSLIFSTYKWFKEIIIESTFKGEHTLKVQSIINTGLILFIISEIVIFATLFYCLFYVYFIPSVECNNSLLSTGIEPINYLSIPLLNTALLFFGSLTITAAQHTLITKKKSQTILLFLITIVLNLIFSLLQLFEYYYSPFTITDSFYGSIFYFLTGTHALHVIVGSCLLISALLRLHHYTNNHHILSTFSSLYNHFVDVVWIILFALLYIYLS